MKKQVSPVVTVVVILVVVAIIAVLYMHFSGGGGGGGGSRGGMSLNIDLSKADLEAAREKAREAKEKLLEQRRGGRAPGS